MDSNTDKNPKLTEKQRNAQMNKEAVISMILYFLFFIWWYVTGYGLGEKDPSTYTYILGLPMWFFLSSVLGYVLFVLATIFVIKVFFKNFDLGGSDE